MALHAPSGASAGSLWNSPLTAVFLGALLGFTAFQLLGGPPQVGLIQIDGAITQKAVADDIVRMLRYAEEERSIKAVVLEINSPGGEVAITEEIYLNVLRLREKKPVVASISQMGASGAYYVAVGANRILAKPSSSVGSIGVVSMLPERSVPAEDTVATGPFKETGSPREDYAYEVEAVKDLFLRSVLLQRGERLRVTEEELSKAKLYLGTEALEMGLIDGLGTNQNAVEEAATLAALRNYGVLNINEELGISLFYFPFFVNASSLPPTDTKPVHYYLYLPPGGLK
jgi:protease-4